MNFPGQMYEYKAEDFGFPKILDSITASKTLWLKKGCPVILLQNISNELVNGLRGKVTAMENGPVIEFENGIIRNIEKMKFSVFSPSDNKDIATRIQYPLKPAFGLTIHKAQGMTLDRVEVDCKGIFTPGQLGVALSRAQSSEGLRVVNYHPRYVLHPAKVVKDFMNEQSSELFPDLSCCRNKKDFSAITLDTIGSDQESSPPDDIFDYSESPDAEIPYEEFDEGIEDEFDSLVLQILRDEERMLDFEFPEGFDYKQLKQTITVDKVVTATQENINDIISKLDDESLKLFLKKLLTKMRDILVSTIRDEDVPKGIPEKNLNKFLQQLHQYSISAEYNMNCLILFKQESGFTDEHKIVCYKMLEFVKLFYIKKKVDLLKIQSVSVSRRYVTNASRARIRYVAGYVIASLKRKYLKNQKSNMYSASKHSSISYQESKCKVMILDFLKEDEVFLKENTSEPDSLIDIDRRQNLTRGLTNVPDSIFLSFCQANRGVLKKTHFRRSDVTR